MVSFSLCKLMAGASISVSKTKALKALIPTECMQVDQNVCKCSRAPCLLIDLSSFSSNCNNTRISQTFLNNELSAVQTRDCFTSFTCMLAWQIGDGGGRRQWISDRAVLTRLFGGRGERQAKVRVVLCVQPPLVFLSAPSHAVQTDSWVTNDTEDI